MLRVIGIPDMVKIVVKEACMWEHSCWVLCEGQGGYQMKGMGLLKTVLLKYYWEVKRERMNLRGSEG